MISLLTQWADLIVINWLLLEPRILPLIVHAHQHVKVKYNLLVGPQDVLFGITSETLSCSIVPCVQPRGGIVFWDG